MLVKLSYLFNSNSRVTITFSSNDQWAIQQPTYAGHSRTVAAFKDALDGARGYYGHYIDADALAISDLAVALRNQLSHWIPEEDIQLTNHPDEDSTILT